MVLYFKFFYAIIGIHYYWLSSFSSDQHIENSFRIFDIQSKFNFRCSRGSRGETITLYTHRRGVITAMSVIRCKRYKTDDSEQTDRQTRRPHHRTVQLLRSRRVWRQFFLSSCFYVFLFFCWVFVKRGGYE